jgi:hypothetical protein
VPMGLQPAASYFQYYMLMIVLAGLAYEICEGYIDDIIVHGQSESDLIPTCAGYLSDAGNTASLSTRRRVRSD